MGRIPESLFDEHYFGIVMDTGRYIHRQGYRELWRNMLTLSPREIPLEIFLAAGLSREEAEKMHYEYNASIHGKTATGG